MLAVGVLDRARVPISKQLVDDSVTPVGLRLVRHRIRIAIETQILLELIWSHLVGRLAVNMLREDQVLRFAPLLPRLASLHRLAERFDSRF